MPASPLAFLQTCCRTAALLGVASCVLMGCQSDRNASTATTGSRHPAAMTMPAATSDGEFAAMMAMHHTGAIEMGHYEAQNGSRSEVREMARKIADAQAAEKPKLEAIARETGHTAMQPDPKMQEHSMKNMQALRAARGAEVDRVFLIHMIDHHEQGIDMARSSMPNLRREDLRGMARKTIDDQIREVARMRAMLNQ